MATPGLVETWQVWPPPWISGAQGCNLSAPEVLLSSPDLTTASRQKWLRHSHFRGEWNKIAWTNQFLWLKSTVFLFSKEEPLFSLCSIKGIVGEQFSVDFFLPYCFESHWLISRSFMLSNHPLKYYSNTKFTVTQTCLYYFSENHELNSNIHRIRFLDLLSTQSSLCEVNFYGWVNCFYKRWMDIYYKDVTSFRHSLTVGRPFSNCLW